MRVFGLDAPTPPITPVRATDSHWRAKIDYLSVTSGDFHVPHDPTTPADPAYLASGAHACRAAGLHSLASEPVDCWSPQNGRSGYVRSSAHPVGARLFTGHATARPLLEMGGAACDRTFDAQELLRFIQRNVEGVTRIDLAADLTCDVSPAEFVSAGLSPRVGTRASASSATGQTEYIGSPKSDRMCRVYRYAPPHPRSDALRVEVVLRREQAKTAALALCTESISAVFWAFSASFCFAHPQWRLPVDLIEVRRTLPRERTSAGRLRWLEKQIRPAVLSAHRDGLIDLRRWLSELDA